MKQTTKFQRLVEVMSIIDKSFKPKLNENIENSYGDDDYMENNEKFEYNDRMDAEFRKFASDLYQKQNRINIKDELYSFADQYNFQRSAVDDALNKPEFIPNKKEGYDYLVYDLNKIDNIINHIVNSSGSQMNEFSKPTETNHLKELANDIDMVIGELVLSRSKEELVEKINNFATDYTPESLINNPKILDYTKKFIVRKFKNDPHVRDAFSNMLSWLNVNEMSESGYLGENREQSLTVSLEDKDFEELIAAWEGNINSMKNLLKNLNPNNPNYQYFSNVIKHSERVISKLKQQSSGNEMNEDYNERIEFRKKIEDGDVWLEYYPPSESQEYTDGETWYNRSGQTLREPDEYRDDTEGYTPFGDE